jgi:hypothetical protein
VPDFEWDPVFKSNYESACFSYSNWLYEADNLLESASMLEPQVRKVFQRMRDHSKNPSIRLLPQGMLGTHFMLVSFAIENLFKAAMVREHGPKYKLKFGTTELPKPLKSHKLLDLARCAGFKVDTAREDLLRRMTRCAEWQGRYPVALKYEVMSGTEVQRWKYLQRDSLR